MGGGHWCQLGGGEVMTIQERAARYNAAFPQFPDSHFMISDRWVSATWILGNDYRGSGMYGSYPPGYLPRITTMFPDVSTPLHLFGGSLAAGLTVDRRVNTEVQPRVQADRLTRWRCRSRASHSTSPMQIHPTRIWMRNVTPRPCPIDSACSTKCTASPSPEGHLSGWTPCCPCIGRICGTGAARSHYDGPPTIVCVVWPSFRGRREARG